MMHFDSSVGRPTPPKNTPGVLCPHAEGASAHAEVGSLKKYFTYAHVMSEKQTKKDRYTARIYP
jgi:hypothetical protein